MPSIIRSEFVLDWCERKRSERDRQWDLIGDRDTKFRHLNRAFGFLDAEQRPSTGRKTRSDAEYTRAYDQIEADFRGVYDAFPSVETEWLRANNVSTYEYLLLDNYELGDSRFFVEQLAAKSQMNPLEVIGLKARSFLKRWVEEHRLAGVLGAIETEIQMFPYAAARCRRFFGIRVWHLAGNAEIRRYRSWWVRELHERFDRLRIELP